MLKILLRKSGLTDDEFKKYHIIIIEYDGTEVSFETEKYATVYANKFERFKELINSGEIITR